MRSVLKKKNITMLLVVTFAVLSVVMGGVAFASSHSFGYTLPGYQENVTLQAGTRSSSSNSAGVSVTQNGAKKFWLWCDSKSVGNRLTNSVLVTGNNWYTLPYWSTASGRVLLRGCTDGWVDPFYISGSVSF